MMGLSSLKQKKPFYLISIWSFVPHVYLKSGCRATFRKNNRIWWLLNFMFDKDKKEWKEKGQLFSRLSVVEVTLSLWCFLELVKTFSVNSWITLKLDFPRYFGQCSPGCSFSWLELLIQSKSRLHLGCLHKNLPKFLKELVEHFSVAA